jgi:23S rRNA (uridine2552-2'-O)-methyltransferase
MLHNTMGHRDTDHLRSVGLVESVLDYCDDNLRQGGSLLAKFLRGREDKIIMEQAKTKFEDANLVKPAASRGESSEIYLLALRKK